MVSCTPWALYPHKELSRLGGDHSHSGCCGEEKILSPTHSTEPHIHCFLAHSQLAVADHCILTKLLFLFFTKLNLKLCLLPPHLTILHNYPRWLWYWIECVRMKGGAAILTKLSWHPKWVTWIKFCYRHFHKRMHEIITLLINLCLISTPICASSTVKLPKYTKFT